MVIRRFKKKGSVYHALASTSGLDFSPVVHLKSFHTHSDDISFLTKNELFKELKQKTTKLTTMSPVKDHIPVFELVVKEESASSALNLNPYQNLEVKAETPVSQTECKESEKYLTSCHEKYPSCPVSISETISRSHRYHSWTGQTEYPKEVSYSRSGKPDQYKTSPNQFLPGLEKSFEFRNVKKNLIVPFSASDSQQKPESYKKQVLSCSSSVNQFDFEGFHTPSIPQCFEDDFSTYSLPPSDMFSISPCKSLSKFLSNDYFGQYENEMSYQSQFSSHLPNREKHIMSEVRHVSAADDLSFLDHLQTKSVLGMSPPAVLAHETISQFQYGHQQEIDIDVLSENGTWMDSIESSSHGRGITKWQGSFSDLSTSSTQLSNQSSLFDSGHSTMPENGRFSPQSSCNSAASSLVLEEPIRAHVIARHESHHEIVAHSSRVQQPKRHGSESILYYTTGTTKTSDSLKTTITSKPTSPENSREEKYISKHASKCIRKNSDSYISADLYSQPQHSNEDYIRVSSLDTNSKHCIPSYASCFKPKVFDQTTHFGDHLKPEFLNDKLACEYTKLMLDEKAEKVIFPEVLKKPQVSDPDLKAIQKQAVMSFYRRMSLAESVKTELKPFSYLETDAELLPLSCNPQIKNKTTLSKFSSSNKSSKSDGPCCSAICSFSNHKLASEVGLFKTHSKSVPNLAMFKGQNLDLPASHPVLNYVHNGSKRREYSKVYPQEQGFLLNREDISVENTKSQKMPTSSSGKDSLEENGSCSSKMHTLTPNKSVRKVQLKEVYSSNETASVKMITSDGLTLLHTNESKEVKSAASKRRPAPPPPKVQPPRRPPPPPPPITPPPTQVMVVVDEIEDNKENSQIYKALKDAANISSELNMLPAKNSIEVDSDVVPLISQSAVMYNAEDCSSSDLPTLSVIEKDEVALVRISRDVSFQPKVIDKSSLLTYPENSHTSYQSQQKLGCQGYSESYQQTFHHTEVSMDLFVYDNNFCSDQNVLYLSNQELVHNKVQPSATAAFHSDCKNRPFQQETTQSFIVKKVPSDCLGNISNFGSHDLSMNELSYSTSMLGSDEQNNHQSPFMQKSSHEKAITECQTSPDFHQKLLSMKSVPLSSSFPDVITSESSDFNNEIQIFANVDLNQNPVKVQNGNNPILQIQDNLGNKVCSASQTTDTDSLYCQQCRTKEDIEYECLSKDFVHYYRDAALMNLLIPSPNHKTMVNYIKGLLNVEFHKYDHQSQHCVNSLLKHQNIQRMEKLQDECSPLVNLSTDNFVQIINNQNVNNEELKEKKEKLMFIICKKVDSLKVEQRNIRKEMVKNDLLGQEIANNLKEFAKPNELEKYSLHVEEIEKIVNLLLSLSSRLARAENTFKSLPANCNAEEKKIMETKWNKLREQHNDACRLKESIDQRSNYVSTFLQKYFSNQQYLDYNHFIKKKTKLIVDNREIDEKINLGEEQLAALRVLTHLWRGTNSFL